MMDVTVREEGVELAVTVVPGASRDEVVGEHGGALKIRVSAAPERGKANKAVSRLLAKALGLKPSAVVLLSGRSSRKKRFLLRGVTAEQARLLVQGTEAKKDGE